MLRNVIPAYLHQIEKAVNRQDLLSIIHRIAAFLAIYFDIIHAINRVTHPGEKRLIQLTLERCEHVPEGMQSQVEAVLNNATPPSQSLIEAHNLLIDSLGELLKAEGLLDHP